MGCKGRRNAPRKHGKKLTHILLSGFVPLMHNIPNVAADTAYVGVNARVDKQIEVSGTAYLDAGEIIPTAQTGALQVNLSGYQTITYGLDALGGGAAGILRVSGPTTTFEVKADMGTAGLKMQTSMGATGFFLSKVQIGSDPNGFTKKITLAKGTTADHAADVKLQGRRTAANNVAGLFYWSKDKPPSGRYTGALTIVISRL